MSVKDFQVIAKLGEGAYSSVYKVKRTADQQDYALKKVKLANLSEKEKQNALNEVRILASIRCLNIVSYKEVFLDTGSNSLCIVMEYVNHGDLFQKIVECQKKGTLIPEPEIWNIFFQVTKGVKSLHDLRIYHRDLKSANVFLNKDGTVKLGDMNVSKIAKKGLLYTQTGTPYYASPEVWKDQPYDQKSDIWSLGCVLYEMTTLKPPFRAEDMEGLYKKVIRGYYPKIPQCYSQDLGNVIRSLLQVPPQLRPNCDKILQLPACQKRMEDKILIEADEGQIDLLQTIRIPKNMHYLTERLPKPNYSPMKLKKIDKNRFIQTLGLPTVVDQYYQDDESYENNSAEHNGAARLPKIHKRSNPPERKQGGGSHSSVNESQINLINEPSEAAERRIKNSSKHQHSKQNYDEVDSKKKQHISNGLVTSSVDGEIKSQAINIIYGGAPKKMPKKKYEVESKKSSLRPIKNLNMAPSLDIEGETKQLTTKLKKNNQSSVINLREDSMIEYDNGSVSRLPLISKERRVIPVLPTLINEHAQQKIHTTNSKTRDEVMDLNLKKAKQRSNVIINNQSQIRRIQDTISSKHALPDIVRSKHNNFEDEG